MAWSILTGFLLCWALFELAIRLAGVNAFPLYAQGEATYRMKADQAGTFRRRNGWHYDRHGQRSDLDPTSLEGLHVVVGDSVVDGGIHVDQADTLAARLGELTGGGVYPVGCHGWSLGNELAMLRTLPGWRGAARLTFVLNSGDFDSLGTASSGFSFPMRRPVLILPWLILRKIYRTPAFVHLFGWKPSLRFDPAVRAAILADFAAAMGEFAGPVALVRYPQAGEDVAAEPFFAELCAAGGAEKIHLIDLAGRADWGNDCYLDHIHPNHTGIRVLARAIAEGAC